MFTAALPARRRHRLVRRPRRETRERELVGNDQERRGFDLELKRTEPTEDESVE